MHTKVLLTRKEKSTLFFSLPKPKPSKIYKIWFTKEDTLTKASLKRMLLRVRQIHQVITNQIICHIRFILFPLIKSPKDNRC
jgi:hypothetical protein